jgi:hypothetical protein
MPYVMGRKEKQEKLIMRLDKVCVYSVGKIRHIISVAQEFVACARRYNLALGDFPNVQKFRQARTHN